jgi:hypothetical protein
MMYSIGLYYIHCVLEPQGHVLKTIVLSSVILIEFFIISSLISTHKITIMQTVLPNDVPIRLYCNNCVIEHL